MSITVSQEEIGVGLVFYYLSKVDDDSPLPDDPSEKEAQDGWDFFKQITDSSGGMSLSTFQNQLRRAIKKILQQTNFSGTIANALSTRLVPVFTAAEDLPTKIEKAMPKVVEKLLDAVPTLALAIFRFFDIDSSGSISKEELIACVKIGKSAFDLSKPQTAGNKINKVLIFRTILTSFFRIFDENQNGTIEAPELSSIFSSWIVTFFNLLTDIVILVEDALKGDEIKQNGIDVFLKLQSVTTSENGEINIEETLKKASDSMPDEEQIQEAFIALSTQLSAVSPSQIVPDLEGRKSTVGNKTKALVDALRQKVQNGKISRDMCIGEVLPVFCDIVELFLTEDVTKSSSEAALAKINDFLVRSTPVTTGISAELLADTSRQLISHLSKFLRERGGLNQIIKTVLDLIDVNNDQTLSKDEVENLGNALAPFIEDGFAGTGVKGRLINVIKAYLRFLDADSSGSISPDEVQIFVGKVVEFIFAYILLSIYMLKEAVVAVFTPLTKILLDLKAQLVGGSPSSLSELDLVCLIALASMERSSPAATGDAA